ncbi:MAG: MotA/TolQ/ExbB proton channel family protein, partial [Alistipes sp.]|nr:MotA/TolQ/ExbB proton channel family protein [Alistipes sp.]
MKKNLMFLAVAVLGTVSAFAQGAETELAGETMHQVLMQKFLEGGWGWMMPVLVCLVIGLAIAIERMLFLAFSNINTKKFIAKFEETLNNNGVEAAKDLCRNTR